MKIGKSFFFCNFFTTLFYKTAIRRRNTREDSNLKILAENHKFAYKNPFRWFETFRNNQPGNFSSKEKLLSKHPQEIFHLIIPNSESRFPNIPNPAILRPIHPRFVRYLNTRNLIQKQYISSRSKFRKKQSILFCCYFINYECKCKQNGY